MPTQKPFSMKSKPHGTPLMYICSSSSAVYQRSWSLIIRRDPSIREISFEDRFALMVDAEYNNYKTLYVRLSDRHRASRSNQRHLHEGSLWSTQVIATEVAQFLSDTWLTRHRKGGSAALEYSKSSISELLGYK